MSTRLWADEDVRTALERTYHHAVRAVDPGASLRRALDRVDDAPSAPLHLLAAGKAALGMYDAAAQWLAQHDSAPVQGLVVTSHEGQPATTDPVVVVGDHPVPGPGSAQAADALDAFADGVAPDHAVWLLLSGGASSLLAAPVPGVTPDDLGALFHQLINAGLDIHDTNVVRKRFLRWGAGRLSRALAPAACRTFAISDVIGDVPATIGAGPTSADDATVAQVVQLLREAGLWDDIPQSLKANIAGIESGAVPETPNRADPIFANHDLEIIATNQTAREAAADFGRGQGWAVHSDHEPLGGEAAVVGRTLGSVVAQAAEHARETELFVWGGETVVTMPSEPAGRGGRCQELALSAAEPLSACSSPTGLLAAGTDGRDGPTDAAGAIVTGTTWRAIQEAARSPQSDLSTHASYQALAAAGALLMIGPTGTNVADLVLGLVPLPGR